MESLGVISPVCSPTPWCASMVVVPKPSGKVRIYVDLKHLNESVQREYHPLPHVEETLAQLSGAQVFTKLVANSCFWQIPLARNSRLLTIPSSFHLEGTVLIFYHSALPTLQSYFNDG